MRVIRLTSGKPCKVLLHVWSYDFYDMDYFTEYLDGHVIKHFIMINSAEHEIFSANKYENANNILKLMADR